MPAHKKAPPRPIRVRLWDAARLLGLNTRTLQREVSRGVFTPVRPRGVGPGKPCYLLTAEIDLYAAGRLDELAALVALVAKNKPR